MSRPNRQTPLRVGAVGWFFVLIVLIVAMSGGVMTGLGRTARPPVFGWILCCLALALAVRTVDRWAGLLPGIFGIAVLNGLIIVVSGHAPNQPTVAMSRFVGCSFTVLMAAAAAATARFSNEGLTNSDRVASIGIFLSFVAMFASVIAGVKQWEVPVSACIVVCVALIWFSRRLSPATRTRLR